jgi:hypothetical protein
MIVLLKKRIYQEGSSIKDWGYRSAALTGPNLSSHLSEERI